MADYQCTFAELSLDFAAKRGMMIKIESLQVLGQLVVMAVV